MALGVLVVVLAITQVDKRFYWSPRLMLAVLSAYVILLAADIVVLFASPEVNSAFSIRGMFIADETVGYRLQPGWRGTFDDGIVQHVTYTVNSHGHRDSEPEADGSHRVLLMGDSFTFGDRLDDADTIDRQLESQSNMRFDAYNLGVSGYGAPAVKEAFRRAGLNASHAIYLFFLNDLRNDALDPMRNTVRHGYVVTSSDESGNRCDNSVLDARIDRALSPPSYIGDTIRLRHIVSVVCKAIARRDASPERESAGEPLGYRRANVQLVIDNTLQMKEIASERGIAFAVFVVPSRHEVQMGSYYPIVQDYIAELGKSGVEVMAPLDKFSASDYFHHDGHFNPRGASKAASQLLMMIEGYGSDKR